MNGCTTRNKVIKNLIAVWIRNYRNRNIFCLDVGRLGVGERVSYLW